MTFYLDSWILQFITLAQTLSLSWLWGLAKVDSLSTNTCI
jgi:hypothetical protein